MNYNCLLQPDQTVCQPISGGEITAYWPVNTDVIVEAFVATTGECTQCGKRLAVTLFMDEFSSGSEKWLPISPDHLRKIGYGIVQRSSL